MHINRVNRWLLAVALLVNTFAATAQKDTFRSKWLPDHYKLQFAGAIGFFSIGAGYKTKKDKLHADLHYGYTPQSIGGLHIHALTAKTTWFPIKNINHKTWQVRPLTTGLLVNYTFGKQYFGFTPDNYPYTYYDFPTAFHVGVFVGGQVNKQVKSRRGIRRVGLYYELGTYDVELASHLRSPRAISVTDILNLGIGVVTAF